MRLTWIITLGVPGLLSCGSPTMVCACPPGTFDTVVYGRVATADGAPVAGAQVFIEHRVQGCESEARESERAVSQPTGNYRVYYRLLTSRSPESCLVARAEPPAGSVLLPSLVLPFDVRFGSNQPVDSVRMDIVLRAP